MRLEIWQPAGTFDVPGKGEFTERFAPHSWDSQVGKKVPLKVAGRQVGTGTLVAAKVADDGSGVTLTIETDVTIATQDAPVVDVT